MTCTLADAVGSIFWRLDFAPLLAAVLAGALCGLLSGVLVLRRSAMLGDAISHAVLPGLVIAFLLTGTRSVGPMLIGAALAGVLAVGMIEALRRLARVEAGAATGVVFSVFFALGVVLINAYADAIDLDPGCVLYGSLEGLRWPGLNSPSNLLNIETLTNTPRPIATLAATLAVTLVLLAGGFKLLRLWCFDAGLMASLGLRPGLVGCIVIALVAAATVASFEAVGSILVVALLACPGAAARHLTDRFGSHLLLSTLLAVLAAVAGYTLAVWGPGLFGHPHAVSAPGMIAVCSGVILLVCVLGRMVRKKLLALSPRHFA
ncbi:MAG: metal ABC transporter permease [bacterium]